MNDRQTRIKICGLTRAEDAQAAIAAGADAIGFVFYRKSPRYIAPDAAARLISVLPPFVTTVGLFVNASCDEVAEVVAQTPISLLQFHGDETAEACDAAASAVNRRFLRAIRIRPDISQSNLLECEQDYRAASKLFAGLLLDTYAEGYGGSGKVFDWSVIPEDLAHRVVLSGGLSARNATEAVVRVRPYAVDVSSGVEIDKGIKDAARIRAFIDAVRLADATFG
ncbi:MAG TPA: phosphoribosylanthranilate isomerase [Paucimonas sp.]|nr:phosphoribosylanthranilate isomerase [Paucimonas sp.]HJW54432.1 phosphoribosylanthranilate isomerase [Burkholderiaceae bacterium]